MSTNAELAGRLLRQAAEFFHSVGEQNPPIKEQMETNAQTYDLVADWVDEDPMANSPLSATGSDD